MARATLIESTLASYGGLATTYELVGHGCEPETLRIFARSFRNGPRVIHVRRGWWALADVSPEVIAARRAGGRLACVSALVHHGVLAPTDSALHIVLDRHSRLLVRDNIVAHWSRRALAGDRQAVRVDVALAQARLCSHAATGTL